MIKKKKITKSNLFIPYITKLLLKIQTNNM